MNIDPALFIEAGFFLYGFASTNCHTEHAEASLNSLIVSTKE